MRYVTWPICMVITLRIFKFLTNFCKFTLTFTYGSMIRINRVIVGYRRTEEHAVKIALIRGRRVPCQEVNNSHLIAYNFAQRWSYDKVNYTNFAAVHWRDKRPDFKSFESSKTSRIRDNDAEQVDTSPLSWVCICRFDQIFRTYFLWPWHFNPWPWKLNQLVARL